jgi:fatty-acyl-CoA synthase
MKYPKVLECAVIAVKDDLWGERPKAFITLKPEYFEHEAIMAGDIEREVIDHCRVHLANFKCPARVEIEADGLPKTSTGKIQKFVLREREWKGRGDKRVA